MATATVVAPTVRVKRIPSTALKNILFATDFSVFSRQALPYAAGLARKFGSHLHLCHVVTASQLAVAAPEAAPFLYEAMHDVSTELLSEMARSPEVEGLKTTAVLQRHIQGRIGQDATREPD